jgi:uncharacterized membrane protein
MLIVISIIVAVLVIGNLVGAYMEGEATHDHINRLIEARKAGEIDKETYDFTVNILTSRDEY